MSIKKKKDTDKSLFNDHGLNDTSVSDIINDVFDEVPLSTIGQLCLDARVSKGLTIERASTLLRVKVKTIKDFEDGKEIDLPGLAYKIGFVRSYGRLLELDSDLLVEEFKQTLQTSEFREEYKFLSPQTYNNKLFPLGSIISLLIAVLVYTGWYYSDRKNTNVALIENSKQTINRIENNDNLTYEIIEEKINDNNLNTLNEDKLTSQSNKLVFQGTVEENEKSKKTIVDVVDVNKKEFPTDQNVHVQTNELSAKANERNPSTEMVLKASGNSWVEIEDLEGNILLTRLMRPGETYVVPDINGLTINTGNAGVLSLSQGEVHVPKLGEVGEIITAKPLNIKSFSNITNKLN